MTHHNDVIGRCRSTMRPRHFLSLLTVHPHTQRHLYISLLTQAEFPRRTLPNLKSLFRLQQHQHPHKHAASFNAASPATPCPYTATPLHPHPALQRPRPPPLQTTHRAPLHGPSQLHRIRPTPIHARISSPLSRRPSPHLRKRNL